MVGELSNSDRGFCGGRGIQAPSYRSQQRSRHLVIENLRSLFDSCTRQGSVLVSCGTIRRGIGAVLLRSGVAI